MGVSGRFPARWRADPYHVLTDRQTVRGRCTSGSTRYRSLDGGLLLPSYWLDLADVLIGSVVRRVDGDDDAAKMIVLVTGLKEKHSALCPQQHTCTISSPKAHTTSLHIY